MEVLARKKAEHDKAALEKRIAEMLEAARDRENLELFSQNGSNSRNHVVNYFNNFALSKIW